MPLITKSDIKNILRKPDKYKYLIKNSVDFYEAILTFPHCEEIFVDLLLRNHRLFRRVVTSIDALRALVDNYPQKKAHIHHRLLKSKITFFNLILTFSNFEYICSVWPSSNVLFLNKLMSAPDLFRNFLVNSKSDKLNSRGYSRGYLVDNLRTASFSTPVVILHELQKQVPELTYQILDACLIDKPEFVYSVPDRTGKIPSYITIADTIAALCLHWPERIDQVLDILINDTLTFNQLLSSPRIFRDLIYIKALRHRREQLVDCLIAAVTSGTIRVVDESNNLLDIARICFSRYQQLINLFFEHPETCLIGLKTFFTLCERNSENIKFYIDWLFSHKDVFKRLLIENVIFDDGCQYNLINNAPRWGYRSNELLTEALKITHQNPWLGPLKSAYHVLNVCSAFPDRKDDVLRYVLLTPGYIERLERDQDSYSRSNFFDLMKMIGERFGIGVETLKISAETLHLYSFRYKALLVKPISLFRANYNIHNTTVCLSQGRRQAGCVLEGFPSELIHKIAGFAGLPHIQNGEEKSLRLFQSKSALFGSSAKAPSAAAAAVDDQDSNEPHGCMGEVDCRADRVRSQL